MSEWAWISLGVCALLAGIAGVLWIWGNSLVEDAKRYEKCEECGNVTLITEGKCELCGRKVSV